MTRDPSPLPLPPSRSVGVDLPNGFFPVSYAVLADNSLAIIAANHDINAAMMAFQDTNPPTPLAFVELARQAEATIFVHDGRNLSKGPHFPLLTAFPMGDRFSDGSWIVIGGYSPQNMPITRIISSTGAVLHTLMLGDGILHMQIDAHDRIWVGWIDQGIFGNDEWTVAGCDGPPSRHGLACFDRTGALLWHNTALSIDDCYAMNVCGPNAWVSTYMGFPIACFDGRQKEQIWQTNISGTSAIAVDYPYVVAAGGYRPRENGFSVFELRGASHQLKATGTLDWIVADRTPQLFSGRNTLIHSVADNLWRSWSVRDLIA